MAIARYHMSGQIGINERTTVPSDILVFPDPLTAFSRLNYSLPLSTKLIVELIDAQGRVVHTWFNGPQQAGRHEMMIAPPTDLSPGYYVISLNTPEARASLQVSKN